MPRKVFIILLVFLTLAILVYVSFRFESKRKFTASSPETAIEVKNTTWEFVEYTDGGEMKNMVGTDWVLQFGKDSGFIRLCDTHPFTFYTFKDTVHFTFTDKNETTCQESTQTSESTLFDFFKSNPVALRLPDPHNKFKEVLTLISGNKKLVFVPRTSIETGSENKTKQVAITAEICPPVTKTTPNPSCVPYAGDFTVAPIDQEKSITTPFTTNEKGTANIPLPKGSYQISLKSSTKGVKFSPIIFSLVDTKETPYSITLNLTSTK